MMPPFFGMYFCARAPHGPPDHFGFGSIFGELLGQPPNEFAVLVACNDLESRKPPFG
jgi:hypothetical protein